MEDFDLTAPSAASTNVSSLRVRPKQLFVAAAASLLFLFLLLQVALKWDGMFDVQATRLAGDPPRTFEGYYFEDYVVFYVAGQLVAEGRGDQLYDLGVVTDREEAALGRQIGTGDGMAYFNPPFVALAFAPVSQLGIGPASLMFFAASLITVVIGGIMLQRLLAIRQLGPAVMLWLAYLSGQSVVWLVGQGQLSMLLLLGFGGFFMLQQQERYRLSGAALALVLVKPQMLVLPVAILIWKRRWLELISLGSIAMALALVSLTISGLSALWEYPSFALESTQWNEAGVTNERMFGWSGFLATFMPHQSLPHVVLFVAAALLTVAVVAIAFKGHWRPGSKEFPTAMAMLVAGALLLNPHVWLQDMVLTALIAALGFVACREQPTRRSLWLIVGGLVWISQDASPQAITNGVNVVTPVIVAMLLLLFLQLQHARLGSRNEALRLDHDLALAKAA